MECPECGEYGAYVGFNTIECKNRKCKHYKNECSTICSCCGQEGHSSVECPRSLDENPRSNLDSDGNANV